VQHLWTAHASGAELETQLELGQRVEIVTVEEAETLIAHAQEVGRMLNGLIRSLDRTP
jgi:four helix bundle protein